jgi:O-antigen/teichoic acid export membrane protein
MSQRRPLGRNVAANAVTAASVLLTALISVPLMLDDIGLAGYGVWTLAQTLILWTTMAEAGFGPAVQRFVAVGHGAGSLTQVRRLLWSTCLAYAVLGAAVAAACYAASSALVDLFGVPEDLHDDAILTFQIVAGVIFVALLTAGVGNVQQGQERFGALAVSAAAGSLTFLVSVIALLAAGYGLPGIAIAAGLQQAVMLLVRVFDLRSLFGRVELIRGREAVELGGFSLRLQMTTLSGIVNSQTDKVIVGLVASAPVLGQLGIGTQVAEAGRLIAGAALSPIVSRLSITHGAGDSAGLSALYEGLHRTWTLLVIGGTVMGLLVLYPLITGWLGQGHEQAVWFGSALIFAYGLSLLTGTPIAYLRALGTVSLEARLGAVLIACNVVLTIALGIAFGAGGVVCATAIAYLIATLWFFRMFHGSVAPEAAVLPPRVLIRAFVIALLAGGIALAWGLAMVALLPAGVALGGVAFGAGVAAVAYVTLVAQVPPTPAGLRRLATQGIG